MIVIKMKTKSGDEIHERVATELDALHRIKNTAICIAEESWSGSFDTTFPIVWDMFNEETGRYMKSGCVDEDGNINTFNVKEEL